MTSFQYDQSISDEVNQQREYHLEKLKINAFSLAQLSAGALLMMGAVQRDYPDWTGSEDYSDLFDSIGVLFKYYGNRMLDDAYSGSEHYSEEDYQFKDWEDLHLSLSTVEQFELIKFLKKGE